MKQHQMKNSAFIVGLLIICQSAISQSISKYYINMPDALHPTLSKKNRVELLEYHKAHMGDSITNRFGKQAYLIKLDTLNNHLVVKSAANSTLEIKMMNSENKTPLLGVINTVCAPVCHSVVLFYDTLWNKLPIQFIPPKTIEWIKSDALLENIDQKWLEKELELGFISLNFNSGQPIIEAKNNTLEFLSEEDKKVIAPLLSNKIFRYKLVDKQWIKEP